MAGVPEDFVIARNTEPGSTLPYLLRIPFRGGIILDTRADSSSGEAVICHLFQGDVSLDFAQSYAQVGQIAQQYFTGSLPLTAAIAVAAPTRVELRCAESNDALDAVVRATKLVAVQVRP